MTSRRAIVALLLVALQIVGCLLAAAATTEEESGDKKNRAPARLLVEKRVLNKYLVEGRDVVVGYNLFNIGQNTASDISVTDSTFPAEHFEVVSGLLKFVVSRVEPGENMTHTVVLRPREGVWGRYNFTSADVTYRSVEGSSSVQFAYTSEPGEGYIVPERQFDRQFSPHYLDWSAFAVMTIPSLLIPFLLWFKSKSHYERILASGGSKSKKQ